VRRDWWPDEVAHAGPAHLDPEYVARFDRKSPTDWSDTVARFPALGVGPASTVVDLGAGTGAFALGAVDPSPAMVELMRARGIDAVEAGFLTYEHSGAKVELVHSRNALHHLSDFWKTVALARIVKPGGVLVLEDFVYSFAPAETAAVVEQWLARAATDPAQGWTAGELAEHVRVEHSTFSWLLEPMLEQTGFEVVDRWYSESRVYASYTCRLR
jgi:SAM-dependent methyltransferase